MIDTMANPIIEYGQKRDKAIEDQKAIEKAKFEQEISNNVNRAIREFEEVFSELLPVLKDSEVNYGALIEDERNPAYTTYIFFEAGGVSCKMDWHGPKHYRYCYTKGTDMYGDMVLGEWPIEGLMGYLYDKLFQPFLTS